MDRFAQGPDFRDRFRAYVHRHRLIASGRKIVAGVSGGMDSVCLLRLLCESDVDVHVVHVNYGFRGKESDDDEGLVRAVCSEWQVGLTVRRPDPAWREESAAGSLQEAARDLRYKAMLSVADELRARTVAVAHHRDDQAETMLLRLFRGAGAQGLAAMRPRRPLSDDVMLVRPLLFASRSEIEAFVAEEALPFRNDRSNEDERFDRVRVRQTVLPAIRSAFGESAVANIGEAADHMREIIDEGIGPVIEADLARAFDERAGCAHLDLDVLTELPAGRRRLLLLRALQRFLPDAPQRATVIERIENLLYAAPGKRLALDAGTIWRDRDAIAFVREPIIPAEAPVPVSSKGGSVTPYGKLVIEDVDPARAEILSDTGVEIADGRMLDRPLTLGPWRPGERFRPLGSPGTKKISDFLTDAKVPTYLRRSMAVLRSGEEVVWIVGLRLAHPFRLTEHSSSAVRITFEGGY